MFCTSGPHDQDGHVAVQIHLTLLTATLALQLKPGRSCNCRCKSVTAADPTIKHADAPNVLLVQEMSTVKIHHPHLTATLALQLEPGKVVVVSANSAAAADPTIEQADAPNVLMVLVMSTGKIHLPLVTATLAFNLNRKL